MKRTIEICIPAFNEESVISESAGSVLRVLRDMDSRSVLTIVDNGSTDRTAEVARGVAGVAILEISTRGKGAAVVAAAQKSRADIFGFIDADISAGPEEIPRLANLVENGKCDIAIGSRLLGNSKVDRGLVRTVLSRAFNLARKFLVGIAAEDTQCGLKIMNARGREILSECVETGWFFDIEFLARASRAGLRIKEVPVRWNEYRFPNRESKLNHFRDGVGALRAMFRIRRRLMEEKPKTINP